MSDVGVLLPAAPITTIDGFLAAGGGEGLRAARTLGPEATIEEITASGLRGRGGAGFPTGSKWASIRAAGGGTHYAVANGAEGEPATFKDRTLMRADPYRIVEGLAIAAFAVDAAAAYIGVKRSFAGEVADLRRAAVELGDAGLLGDLVVTIVEGPDEYLFGEEKALLEVIEGRDPLPRLLPPWQHGLFATVTMGWEAGTPAAAGQASNPTLVNNVETLAAAAHVLARGATWYRSMGTADSAGTVIVTIVGDVRVPGVHEVELGTPLAEVIDRCGGAEPNRTLKAAFSGVSNPVLPAQRLRHPAHLRGVRAARQRPRRRRLRRVRRHRRHGCRRRRADPLPRRRIVRAMPAVQARLDGADRDPHAHRHGERQRQRSRTDRGAARLGHRLPTAATWAPRCSASSRACCASSPRTSPTTSRVAASLERDVVVPKIVELDVDGAVVYDERHRLKLPDWTYAEPR